MHPSAVVRQSQLGFPAVLQHLSQAAHTGPPAGASQVTSRMLSGPPAGASQASGLAAATLEPLGLPKAGQVAYIKYNAVVSNIIGQRLEAEGLGKLLDIREFVADKTLQETKSNIQDFVANKTGIDAAPWPLLAPQVLEYVFAYAKENKTIKEQDVEAVKNKAKQPSQAQGSDVPGTLVEIANGAQRQPSAADRGLPPAHVSANLGADFGNLQAADAAQLFKNSAAPWAGGSSGQSPGGLATGDETKRLQMQVMF